MIAPLPTLEAILPAGNQSVVQLGQTTRIEGHHLDGSARTLQLRNDRFDIDETIAASGSSAADHMNLLIPPARAADFPVGIYDITASVVMPSETQPRTSNRLATVIAPRITNLPMNVVREGSDDAHIALSFTPALRPGQTVSLLLGSEEIRPEAFVAPTTTLTFIARNAAVGAPLARLRIDGVDSPIVDRSTTPPTFFDLRVTIT